MIPEIGHYALILALCVAVTLGRKARSVVCACATTGSDQEVIDFLVARYGDFVRYRPPLKSTTAFLWLGPFFLLVIGGTTLAVALRRRAKNLTDPVLSDEDHPTVAQLLSEGTKRS